jgi:hypothetical protein
MADCYIRLEPDGIVAEELVEIPPTYYYSIDNGLRGTFPLHNANKQCVWRRLISLTVKRIDYWSDIYEHLSGSLQI